MSKEDCDKLLKVRRATKKRLATTHDPDTTKMLQGSLKRTEKEMIEKDCPKDVKRVGGDGRVMKP